MDELETPLLPSDVPQHPLPIACVGTSNTKVRGSRRHAALRRIRCLLGTASSRIRNRRRTRYRMLQSAAESRKVEAQRKKRTDNVRRYITTTATAADSEHLEEEENQQDTDSSTRSDQTDSTDTDSTSGNPASPGDTTTWEPFAAVWDSEDAFPTEDKQEEHDYGEADRVFTRRTQKRPTPRLNLTRKGNWKFVHDPKEVWEWQAEAANRRSRKRRLALERRTIRTLRSTSKQLRKPLQRGFVEFQEATVDRIMFSIIHEEDEDEAEANPRRFSI